MLINTTKEIQVFACNFVPVPLNIAQIIYPVV